MVDPDMLGAAITLCAEWLRYGCLNRPGLVFCASSLTGNSRRVLSCGKPSVVQDGSFPLARAIPLVFKNKL